MEAVLMFEEDELTQINTETEISEDKENGELVKELINPLNDFPSQSQTDEDLYEQSVLKVEEVYRDIFREARFYPDELRQEIFEPNQPWSKWQETKDYKIQVST